MRLFIAINLPPKERKRIHDAAKPLRQAGFPVRWVEHRNYHLTLKFLGEVRSEMVPVAERVMERVAEETREFPVVISGFGAFPTIRRPRILWIGAEPSPALRCLKQDLEWGLAGHGFERETRAFHPHITVARAEDEDGAGAFRGLDELSARPRFRMKVLAKTVDLMRSQVSREGATYSVVKEIPLRSLSRRR